MITYLSFVHYVKPESDNNNMRDTISIVVFPLHWKPLKGTENKVVKTRNIRGRIAGKNTCKNLNIFLIESWIILMHKGYLHLFRMTKLIPLIQLGKFSEIGKQRADAEG